MGVHVGALAAGTFDAAYTLEPQATIAERQGAARRLEAGVIATHLIGRPGAQAWAAGAAFTGLAWLTSGDLGSDLLSGLGPQLVPVLVMATSTMGLSGAVCGLLLGLWRRRPRRDRAPRAGDDRVADAEDTGAPDEETQVLGHRDAPADRASAADPLVAGDELTAPVTRRRSRPAAGPRSTPATGSVGSAGSAPRSAGTARSATSAPSDGADEPTQQIG